MSTITKRQLLLNVLKINTTIKPSPESKINNKTQEDKQTTNSSKPKKKKQKLNNSFYSQSSFQCSPEANKLPIPFFPDSDNE